MRAVVIGAGRMGMFHRRVLRDLGYDVTTVDPCPDAGADWLTLRSATGFDVACIAVPIAHLAERAAEWGGWGFDGHLLIEKPGAACVVDAIELEALLAGQRVAVGYVERFNPRVRRLRELLADSPPPSAAKFTRWNDRASVGAALDLASHDIDLARFLELACPVTYDVRAAAPMRQRTIEITVDNGRSLTVDLTAHDTSPLHAQWHAFLGDRPGHATLADAVAVLVAVAPEAVAA